MKQEKKKNFYVDTVRENTQHYFRELLLENEKLRAQYATLESELRLCSDRARAAEANSKDSDSLRALVSYLGDEKLRLQKQLMMVEAERHCQASEKESLEKRLKEIESENRAFTEQYMAVEQQNSNLANLYVASYRLHETLDRTEVINSIQEIVINLVGSEDFGIYEYDEETGRAELIGSFGKEALSYENIRAGNGVIGGVLKSGERYISAQAEEGGGIVPQDHPVACIPLILGGKVVGAIAIFRLLQHKTCLQQLDFELFDLLATHAATALYLTTLHRKAMLQPA